MEMTPLQPFRVLAADLSLRRPACAILSVDPKEQAIQINELIDIDNRLYGFPHGYLLQRISDMITDLSSEADVFVREGAYVGPDADKTIFMVAGVAALALWQARKAQFYEIYPRQVKEFITGNQFARKEEVAQALARYVGEREYHCDGQSDAIAVGVSWLKLTGILNEADGKCRINRIPPFPEASVRGSVMELYGNVEVAGAHGYHAAF